MKKRIYLSSPHMSGAEIKYINDSFEKNWIAPSGPNIGLFEKRLAAYVGMDYGVAVTSATAAIHLALKTCGVKAGDKVFCSSLTFIASCNPVVYENAVPVFIDSDYETWNMCPAALEKAYEKYPNPAALIVVNLYGQSADYDEIIKIAKKHGTPVIEDAAESLGATYKGKNSGSLGDIGIFSFNGNKIITTSGGGMLLTNDEAAARKARFWATQAREPYPFYEHKEIGYNYRLSSISASIGLGQMEALEERIAKKIYIYNYYKDALEGYKGIEFMPTASFGTPNYWLSTLLLRRGDAPERIIKFLEENNIESRHVWKPMHKQPVFKDCDFFTAGETDCSEDLFERGLCLPSDTKMTNEDLDLVIGLLKKEL